MRLTIRHARALALIAVSTLMITTAMMSRADPSPDAPRAQTLQLVVPDCETMPFHVDDYRWHLRVELRDLGVEVLSNGDASALAQAALVIRPDVCGASASKVIITVGDAFSSIPSTRIVSIANTPEEVRARVLALASVELWRTRRSLAHHATSASASVSGAAPVPSAPAVSAATPAPALPARASSPPPSPALRFKSGVVGEARWFGAQDPTVWGGRVFLEAAVGRGSAIRARIEAGFGRAEASDARGHVQLDTLSVSPGFGYSIAVARWAFVQPMLRWELGRAQASGHSDRADVRVDERSSTYQGLLLGVGLTVSGPSLWVGLEPEAGPVWGGVRAQSDGRRVIGMPGIAVAGRIGGGMVF